MGVGVFGCLSWGLAQRADDYGRIWSRGEVHRSRKPPSREGGLFVVIVSVP